MLQVTGGSVTIFRNAGRDYFGVNQVIDFKRDGGVQDGGYIEFHLNGSRMTYEWCKGKRSIDFGPLGSHANQTVDKIVVKYFENGGFFVSGKLLLQMSYELSNPMNSFSVSQIPIDIGFNTIAKYDMKVVPDLCTIVVRKGSCRLTSFNIITAAGSIEFLVPRIPGTYEVSIIAGRSDILLGRNDLVVCDIQGRGAVHLLSENSNGGRLINVQPGDLVALTAIGGILQEDDEVFFVDAARSLQPPNHTDLINPNQIQSLRNGRTVTLAFPDSGIFYACLGLKYFGSRLLGDYLCVVVSSLAAPALIPAKVLHEKQPPLVAAPLQSSQQQGSGFKCVACFDADVCMKLVPCKHVPLCESCFITIHRSSDRCPICRTQIQNSEKVFVVGAQV